MSTSPGIAEVVAGDEPRLDGAQALVREPVPGRARDERADARARRRRRPRRRRRRRAPRARPRARPPRVRAAARRRARRPPPRRRPPSAASPQRSDAPGPRSQSAHADDASGRCALIAQSRARRRRRRSRRRGSARGARARAGGAGAASASRSASRRRRRGRPRRRCVTIDEAVTDSTTTGWVGCSVAGSPSVPISSTTSSPLGHLADDRVLGRQADVGAGDDEELAAGRARRLGGRLRHRDDALHVGGVRRRRVDGRVAGAAAARLRRVAALDHEARDDPVEDRVVVEPVLGERDERGRGRGRRVEVERDGERAAVGRERQRPLFSAIERAPSAAVAPPASRARGRLDVAARRRRRPVVVSVVLGRLVPVAAAAAASPSASRRGRAGWWRRGGARAEGSRPVLPHASGTACGMPITLEVNGERHVARRRADAAAPRRCCATTSRSPGTKLGCGEGACGACAVLLDGGPSSRASCSSAPPRAARSTTIEGSRASAQRSLQEAFVAEDALQCGFCTPGQIVSRDGAARARTPQPDARRDPRGDGGEPLPLRRLPEDRARDPAASGQAAG